VALGLFFDGALAVEALMRPVAVTDSANVVVCNGNLKNILIN